MKENTIKALLVEDDAEDTLILMDLLAQPSWPSFRFAMSCADTLAAGLKVLREDRIDVVLLDLMLPDGQGIETLLKTRSQAPDVPIVVLTGLKDEALGLDALAHGAQDYVVKGSGDGRALKRTISFAVERHRLLTSLENILAGSADAMVVIDAFGKVRYSNAATEAVLGRKPEELLGKPFPHPLPKDVSAELRLPGPEGAERIAEMRTAAIEWHDQPAVLASIRDITDLRRLEQLRAEVKERRRMDKLKDELMSTVSHEMRTPLTVIKAAVDNLKEGLAGPITPPQREMVDLAHANSERLLKVVGNILDLSRLESGRAVIRRRRFDAARLIRQVVAGFQLTANDQSVIIQRDIPDDLPSAYADPDLFVQVLNNLVDNALRFTKSRILIRAESLEEPPGVVAPATRPAGAAERGRPRHGATGSEVQTDRNRAAVAARKCLEICVVDDGPGIPPERKGELFDKFVQVHRTTGGEGYKGTGLGLAICKEILERQNGRIWFQNGAKGGAEFHFILPLFDATGHSGGSHGADER